MSREELRLKQLREERYRFLWSNERWDEKKLKAIDSEITALEVIIDYKKKHSLESPELSSTEGKVKNLEIAISALSGMVNFMKQHRSRILLTTAFEKGTDNLILHCITFLGIGAAVIIPAVLLGVGFVPTMILGMSIPTITIGRMEYSNAKKEYHDELSGLEHHLQIREDKLDGMLGTKVDELLIKITERIEYSHSLGYTLHAAFHTQMNGLLTPLDKTEADKLSNKQLETILRELESLITSMEERNTVIAELQAIIELSTSSRNTFIAERAHQLLEKVTSTTQLLTVEELRTISSDINKTFSEQDRIESAMLVQQMTQKSLAELLELRKKIMEQHSSQDELHRLNNEYKTTVDEVRDEIRTK